MRYNIHIQTTGLPIVIDSLECEEPPEFGIEGREDTIVNFDDGRKIIINPRHIIHIDVTPETSKDFKDDAERQELIENL